MSALHQTIQRLFSLQANEYRLFAYSFAYVFFLLAAYYVLRPIRDEFGAAGGVENLPWLFAATLAAMLLVNPAFAALVKRWPLGRSRETAAESGISGV
ncbi:MAG: hypothetical protein Q4C79_06810 [Neisseria sp.]|uniref:hypothetical protein n=1 Tax=Neisseria sp. TaxID=192066 RepID=UPI0026DD6EDA|nr:hypothetical protein [Neisseria sp.]MDO4248655.1 hypothetical protein [Neisseria sp.]